MAFGLSGFLKCSDRAEESNNTLGPRGRHSSLVGSTGAERQREMLKSSSNQLLFFLFCSVLLGCWFLCFSPSYGQIFLYGFRLCFFCPVGTVMINGYQQTLMASATLTLSLCGPYKVSKVFLFFFSFYDSDQCQG